MTKPVKAEVRPCRVIHDVPMEAPQPCPLCGRPAARSTMLFGGASVVVVGCECVPESKGFIGFTP